MVRKLQDMEKNGQGIRQHDLSNKIAMVLRCCMLVNWTRMGLPPKRSDKDDVAVALVS